MGRIVATMKIFPEDIIISPDKIKEEIKKALPEQVSIHRIDEDPIAFGLVALIVQVIMPDAGGIINEVEEIIKSIKGVSQVEAMQVRRV
ncbi:elongation factor 1-beta [Candidatus Bathyarchaeota archaeon]|nr:elongation factor 1-beta [Candidatus Bathyarchaeota archaeon]MCK5626163.1 elongation factor 1-beta [Candidatus Bathyarchaeota archaeon]